MYEEYKKLMVEMFNYHVNTFVESSVKKFDMLCGRIEEIDNEYPEFEERLMAELKP